MRLELVSWRTLRLVRPDISEVDAKKASDMHNTDVIKQAKKDRALEVGIMPAVQYGE